MIIGWQLKRLISQFRFWELVFAPVGVGWTLTEAGLEIGLKEIIDPYLFLLWCLLPIGISLAAWVCWPKTTVSKRLPNIDTEIEVRVGDIFKSNNPIVVAVPTTLESTFENRAINRTSLQGQYITNFCGSSNNFSEALIKSSSHIQNFELTTNFYSVSDEVKKFPPGELFVLRDFHRIGYLLTFATFNDHGVAQITPEDFFDLLPKLWLGIRERGDVGSVDVPLMGSRFARIGIDNRKEILRELINSFSAASSEARLADRVTFYIRPADFTRWGFSFEFIERILDNVCDDHRRRPTENTSVGKSA